MPSVKMEHVIPHTPRSVAEFSKDWLRFILNDWFHKTHENFTSVDIISFNAKKNNLQGQLSTTYILDLKYVVDKTEEAEKSIFVKVPLSGPAAQNFKSVNVREEGMLGHVLPQLQTFIEENCTDVLRLPIPEIIYSRYTGDELTDVFVLENLLAAGFEPYKEGNLVEENLKSCLECLAQLHGTGIAFKVNIGGTEEVLKRFPDMEEQAQIKDILDKMETKKCVRRNYLPFLKYLEISDPGLLNYTTFLAKVDKRLFHIFNILNESGLEKILTLCHGDSKPDNFLFRKIEIDLEDMECEGLESILIDWQGGFLGSISNDLMWLLPPFLEANSENPRLLEFSLEYYCTQLNYVLTSFGISCKEANLPTDIKDLVKIIKRCFILEFLNVVVINPIIEIPQPAVLRKWYRRRVRHDLRAGEGRESKPPAMPPQEDIFSRQHFLKFANLYLKVGYILGGFQELNSINFEIVREEMFGDEDTENKPTNEHENDVYEDEEIELSDDEEIVEEQVKKPNLLSRFSKWFLSIFDINRYKNN